MIKELPDYDKAKAVAPTARDADDRKRNSPATTAGETQNIINNSVADSTTDAADCHVEAKKKSETFGDMIDGVINDVLGTKAKEITAAVGGNDKTFFRQQLENLPPEILEMRRFVHTRPDKPKAPYGDWQNPASWESYDDIDLPVGFIAASETAGGLVFYDFDHVLDPATKKWKSDFAKCLFDYLHREGSFCELSQSQEGLHLFAQVTEGKFQSFVGKIHFDDVDDMKLEIFYGTNRNCYVTGTLYQCGKGAPIVTGEAADQQFQYIRDLALKDAEKRNAKKNPQKNTADNHSTQDGDACDERKQLPQEIRKLIADINSTVTPAALEAKGFLEKSPNGLYCCPWCDSGHGDNHSGAMAFYPAGYFVCFSTKKFDSPHGGDIVDFMSAVWKENNRGDNFFKFLRRVADEFGITYDPKIFTPPKKTAADPLANMNIAPELKDEINLWQDDNGKINPELLPKIIAAKIYLDEFTTETITADIAQASKTKRAIALCRTYDFAAMTAEKFAAKLSNAKSAAAAQIKDAKSGLVAEPAIEVQTLANFSLTVWKKTVAQLEAELRKEHKRFVERHGAEHRAAQQKAEEAEYIRDAPTATKFVADCPVDWLVPHDVFFNESGCGIQVFLGNGLVDRRYGAKTPVIVTKRYFEAATSEVTYEIAIGFSRRDGTHSWTRHNVEGRTLQSARGVETLANFGVAIEDAGTLAKYFARFIAGTNWGWYQRYSKTGWHDGKFIYPRPNTDDNYVVSRAGYNFAEVYGECGDATEWRKLFAEAMKSGGSVARIFVGVAVAAPLVKPLKINNLQVHLFGGINAGKTALERLTASIFGSPTELIRTFESSPKRRQADAAANCDLPCFLDELETIRGEKAELNLTQSVYSYFNGVANQNLRRDGTARDVFKFSGSRLSTGERQLLKTCDQLGAYKRLLPLEYTQKLFDKRLATRLYDLTADNYGHFGRMWTDYVAEHSAEIREKFKACAEHFLDDEIHEETQLRTICAAEVAYQFFAQCIGLQDKFDMDNFIRDTDEIVATLPTNEEISETSRAIKVLEDVVAGNENSFYRETNNDHISGHEYEPRSYGENYGKLYLDGSVAFYPEAVKKFLAKKGFASPENILDSLFREGKLIVSDGRKTRRVRIGNTRKQTIYFKAGILSKERDDADTYDNGYIATA